MITFDQLMKGFGVVTAMDMCIWTPKNGYTGVKSCCGENGNALTKDDFQHDAAVGYIDTMKITNINQEGPTKTIMGGRYAAPLVKYGKTTTLEANDALGSAATLVRFFGADYDGKAPLEIGTYTSKQCTGDGENTIFTGLFAGLIDSAEEYRTAAPTFKVKGAGTSLTAAGEYVPETGSVTITISSSAPAAGDIFYIEMTTTKVVKRGGTRISFNETFPGPFAIQGYTEFIDKNGEKKKVYIFIPQFYPNGVFNLTQDTEGDAAVFDLSGTLIPTEIKDVDGSVRTIIYEIRENPFFDNCTIE